jgi:TRAP-type C4-dicarboxylate transport system substrate-binding protein
MRNRQYWLKFLAVLVIGWGLTGTSHAKEVWDMPSIYPATSFHVVNTMTPFAEAVKKVTNGEIEIKIQPGGTLGIKGSEMIVAIRDGIVKIADMSLNLSAGHEPIFRLEGLPRIVAGYSQLALLEMFFRPKVQEILEKKYNQKILVMAPWPAQYLHLKTPVKSVSELRGVKIRAGARSEAELYGGIGLAAMVLPWGEVVPSLAAGTIEGVVTSTSSGVDGKFWEFLKVAYPTNHVWNSQTISVNLDAWNSLKPEYREGILSAAERLQPQYWEKSKEEDRQKSEILMQHGYTVAKEMPTGLKEALDKQAAPIIKDYMEKTPGAREIIEPYLKMIGRTL